MNYALLELVIEAASGEDYATACTRRVLTPAEARGALSMRTGGFAGWGGWMITVDEFAKVHAHWFGRTQETGSGPYKIPFADVSARVHYGLGRFFRRTLDGFNFWHFGAMFMPGRITAGSYAVTWNVGRTVVAAFDRCPDSDALLALDQTMAQAAFQ